MRFVVRQPIVDRDQGLFAHELFFSHSPGERSGREVLPQPSSLIDLSDVTNGSPAFVNLTEAALLRGAARALHPESTVIEVLETVQPSDSVISACSELRKQGFRIALDDFVFRPELQPLVDAADFIKVEWPDVADAISQVRGRRPLTFVAERIETMAQFSDAAAAGYDLFQGYHLGRPEVVAGIESSRAEALCRLFGRSESI